MQSRRAFIKAGALGAATLTIPPIQGCIGLGKIRSSAPLKARPLKKAVVLWFSQTGYTERNGKLIAKTFEKKGIEVLSAEIRDFEPQKAAGADLIVVGSPVFYYDTPAYVKSWIKLLPDISGVAVGSYVTFGGPEGNQHNAACSIVEALVKKGGVPVGIDAFMNMSAWPLGLGEPKNEAENLRRWRLPDQNTYRRVRQYAARLKRQVEKGEAVEFEKTLNFRELSTFFGPIWWTKRLIKNHSIRQDKCIQCGTCVDKCPADAIDLTRFAVDTDKCVLCFGCINNCPANAVLMEYDGKALIGYLEYKRNRNLKVTLPAELKEIG